MNTACLSAYNYVYVPEHLHYIFTQDLVCLVRLCADSDRNTTLLFFAPPGDFISDAVITYPPPAAFNMLLFRPRRICIIHRFAMGETFWPADLFRGIG